MEAAGIEPASANPLLSGLHAYPIFEFNHLTPGWKGVKAAIPLRFSSLISGRSSCELVCYDHPLFTFVNVRSYKHNRWMALCRCLGGYCKFFRICKNSVVAIFLGNYLVCNDFLRG